MRMIMKCAAASALALIAAGLSTVPASAACTKLGFSVNDYGKDGPTKDAKDLLDKFIAKTMAERGITDYKTGPKNVTCELFLNFIVFDEHTCKAEANVCWGGSTPGPAGAETAATAPAVKTASKPKAAPKDAAATAPAAKPAAKEDTAAAPAAKPAAKEETAAAPAATPAAKEETAAAPAATPAAKDETAAAPSETGSTEKPAAN